MKALCVFLTVFITAIFPGSPKVLTTIKPIAFIVNAITVGVGEPAVLLDPQKSPHHHHLSPGELKKLAQADVVFWVGPPLESFLKNFFEQAKNGVALISQPGMVLTPKPYGVDSHIWLSPKNVAVMAKVILNRLRDIDPKNALTYQKNYDLFIKALEKNKFSWQRKVDQVKEVPFMTFHDAYGYLSDEFHLNNKGTVKVRPNFSLKQIYRVREEMKVSQVNCLFFEPFFPADRYEALTQGVHKGFLDPMGIKISLGKDAYFELIDSLLGNMVRCLEKDLTK